MEYAGGFSFFFFFFVDRVGYFEVRYELETFFTVSTFVVSMFDEV